MFPELDALFGLSQPESYNPEIDWGVHSLMALDQAALLSSKLEVRFATLVHDLGNVASSKDNLSHHYGHELKGVLIVEKMCQRLRIPNDFKKLALHVTQYHTHCHKVRELRATTLVDLLQVLGAFKPKHNLQDFLFACEADTRGRLGFENTDYSQSFFLKKVAKYGTNIDSQEVLNLGLKGKKIGDAIRRLRVTAVNELLSSHQNQL